MRAAAVAAHNRRQEAKIDRYDAAVRRLEAQAAREMAAAPSRQSSELADVEALAANTALYVAGPGEGGRPGYGGGR